MDVPQYSPIEGPPVISSLGLLWIKLSWEFKHFYEPEFSFLWDKCPSVQFLDHLVITGIVLGQTAIQFSRVSLPFYVSPQQCMNDLDFKNSCHQDVNFLNFFLAILVVVMFIVTIITHCGFSLQFPVGWPNISCAYLPLVSLLQWNVCFYFCHFLTGLFFTVEFQEILIYCKY